jgi:hypothetical protein
MKDPRVRFIKWLLAVCMEIVLFGVDKTAIITILSRENIQNRYLLECAIPRRASKLLLHNRRDFFT